MNHKAMGVPQFFLLLGLGVIAAGCRDSENDGGTGGAGGASHMGGLAGSGGIVLQAGTAGTSTGGIAGGSAPGGTDTGGTEGGTAAAEGGRGTGGEMALGGNSPAQGGSSGSPENGSGAPPVVSGGALQDGAANGGTAGSAAGVPYKGALPQVDRAPEQRVLELTALVAPTPAVGALVAHLPLAEVLVEWSPEGPILSVDRTKGDPNREATLGVERLRGVRPAQVRLCAPAKPGQRWSACQKGIALTRPRSRVTSTRLGSTRILV